MYARVFVCANVHFEWRIIPSHKEYFQQWNCTKFSLLKQCCTWSLAEICQKTVNRYLKLIQTQDLSDLNIIFMTET